MDLYDQALRRMIGLLARAENSRLKEPSAMNLATADARGRVTSRMVMLKGLDRRGFVFYTNISSRKGRQLSVNPRAALCFYWDPLGEQVRVEGKVRPVSDAEADAYWAGRPRPSQIGAWASRQSAALRDRKTLLERARDCAERFHGAAVPRPPYWTGLRLAPERIEFWRADFSRLNERILYAKSGGRWKQTCLYP